MSTITLIIKQLFTECDHAMDIAFAFDLSGENVFPIQLKFAIGVVES